MHYYHITTITNNTICWFSTSKASRL